MKFEVNRWGKIDRFNADDWTVEEGTLKFYERQGPHKTSTFICGYSLAQLIYWRPITDE